MKNETHNENEYKRAKFFFNKKTIIHVTKKSGTFYNGLILEISKEFFIINDRVNGKQFIFFNELKRPLEPYINKTGDKNGIVE